MKFSWLATKCFRSCDQVGGHDNVTIGESAEIGKNEICCCFPRLYFQKIILQKIQVKSIALLPLHIKVSKF